MNKRLKNLLKHFDKCFWCGRKVVYRERPAKTHKLPFVDNDATVDHLHSRLSPVRDKMVKTNEETTVLACFKCNTKRNLREQKFVPIEELRSRANHGDKSIVEIIPL